LRWCLPILPLSFPFLILNFRCANLVKKIEY
jgi:hypothetical protein